MKVVVDRSKCVGAGLCVSTDPDIFTQSEEDGLVQLLVVNPSAEHHDRVAQARSICPSQAITIVED